jgi:sec-independent protein translocase protein TatC
VSVSHHLDRITDKKMSEEKEMSFLDHLEELRWHILRSLVAVVIFVIIGVFANQYIFTNIIFALAKPDFITYRLLCQLSEATCIDKLGFTLQSTSTTGQFTMYIASLFVFGLICAFPYIFWEVWRFIRPGLYESEQKGTRGAVFFVSVLFVMGISFGYFVLAPLSINFLANFQISPEIKNEFNIVSYVSTVVMLVLGCGIIFQLPVAIYFLSKIEVVTPKLLRTYRRHAIVVILLVAGIITPPDILSQIVISLPVLLLYEFGIFISAWVWKNKPKDDEVVVVEGN